MIRKFGTRDSGYALRISRYALRSLPLWTLLLVVLLASAPLWGPGMVNTRGGGDSPFLLQRLHQMVVNLRAGVFPVRWMPDAAYGLGYPFFNHYSALPFYLAASLHLLGLDPLTALKLTQTLGFLVAALAMYGWVNHLWRDRAAAWLAAVAYTVAPFHLVNVYVRGDSLSEFYAFAFYPLILWALERVVAHASDNLETRFFQKIGFLNVAGLALAYAGLILSHNISAFIFSPFVLLYLAFQVRRTCQVRRTWLLGLSGLLLGAALSAWAWLPALLERDYVQAETLTLGYFNYANHFRAANLVQPGLWFDYSIAVTSGGPSPFAMSAPQALVAAGGMLVLLRLAFKKSSISNLQSPISNTQSLIFLITGLLLSTAMITPLSRPLWDHLPLLATVQFPWRFLSVQALFTALVTGVWVLRLKGRSAWGIAAAIAVLLIASTLLPLQPERLSVGPDDVTTTRLQEYELFTGNIGTTIRYEWLPRDAVPRPFTFDTVIAPETPPQAIPLAGTLVEATQTQRRPTGRTWRVQTGKDGATLAFPLLYWPGWRAWVDGQGTPAWAVEGSGYLALDVPSGEHTVRLALGRTPLRAGAETLSVLTLAVLLATTVWAARRHSRLTPRASRFTSLRDASRLTPHILRHTPHAILVLISLLFLVSRSSSPPQRSDDLTMDFVAKPYLHHNPNGVAFDDQTRLLNYALSTDHLTPGDTLTVTSNWDGGQLPAVGRRVSLRLVSPAEHLPDLQSGPYTLAEDSVPLAVTTVHRLAVPENAPRGLYLVQVQVEGAERGPFYLRPVRVIEGAPLPPDAPVLAIVGPDIRLHAAELGTGAAGATHLSSASHLTVHLEWSTVRRLAANYGVSVRLLDPGGGLRASQDTQPGYGFAPTSLWRPGERVGDRYNLPLPDDLPPGDGYRLLIVFYRHPSLSEVARVALGPFAWPLDSRVVFEPSPRLFELPLLSYPLDVDFAGQIRLAGYELAVEDATALLASRPSLHLTLWWVAQRQPQVDYTAFVHLFDPATEAIAVQHDAMPRQGSYPTSGWLAGEVVSDTVRLSLSDVPAGSYQLAVGLYEVATRDRLPAITPDGIPLPDGRLILPEEIEVSGR